MMSSQDDSNFIIYGGDPIEKVDEFSSIGDQLITELENGGTKTAFVSELNKVQPVLYVSISLFVIID